MTAQTLANELLKNLGGPKKNNLNDVLQITSTHDDQTETFQQSGYYDIDSFIKVFDNSDQQFITVSLNVESLNSKFNNLTALIGILGKSNCYIDSLLIQESWLSDDQCSSKNIEQYHIPGYHTIPLGRKCGRKGGLIIYLRDIFKFSPRDLYTDSLHWEGLFIDITHKNNQPLPNKITLANIYRPPRDNNSNKSIDDFLKPFSEIFIKLSRENSTLITGGDFNLNLLKLTERDKFQEYFDLFVANGSIPQITMPTRFSRRNATLIDHIFCRFSKFSSQGPSGIVVTKISDHLPCFSIINYKSNTKNKPRYITIKKNGPQEMQAFQDEIKTNIENMNFDNDLLADPNNNYEKLEKIINNAQANCFPLKEVKFNKYKHKISPWITFDILNAMKFRDKLYVKWKKCDQSSPNYTLLENSYKSFCAIVQKDIRIAKKLYYHKQFENYKSDIKKNMETD